MPAKPSPERAGIPPDADPAARRRLGVQGLLALWSTLARRLEAARTNERAERARAFLQALKRR